MPRAHITRPLESATLDAPPSDHPVPSENFGDRAWHILNKRAAASASTDENFIVVVENRSAEAELPPQPDTFVDATFYIKLRATLEIIFDSVWGFFVRQYQFNKMDDRMSKIEKVQNVNNCAEGNLWG